mmetsp:Transcript_99152/g.318149  ORF Transcript_99152/g.318149 Transcript_99152/m.318149 type:complete len:354 (-) Transcript_99152:62-1123(-)
MESNLPRHCVGTVPGLKQHADRGTLVVVEHRVPLQRQGDLLLQCTVGAGGLRQVHLDSGDVRVDADTQGAVPHPTPIFDVPGALCAHQPSIPGDGRRARKDAWVRGSEPPPGAVEIDALQEPDRLVEQLPLSETNESDAPRRLLVPVDARVAWLTCREPRKQDVARHGVGHISRTQGRCWVCVRAGVPKGCPLSSRRQSPRGVLVRIDPMALRVRSADLPQAAEIYRHSAVVLVKWLGVEGALLRVDAVRHLANAARALDEEAEALGLETQTPGDFPHHGLGKGNPVRHSHQALEPGQAQIIPAMAASLNQQGVLGGAHCASHGLGIHPSACSACTGRRAGPILDPARPAEVI